MMKSNVRRGLCILIVTVLLTGLLPTTARADMGPKPSIRVTFEGMGEELCYATLLSREESTGPYSALSPREMSPYGSPSYATEPEDLANRAFTYYEDADGFYFLQILWQVNETKELAWTYYPPSEFKILLYYPQRDLFVSSGSYERYAFDSYYTVDMTDFSLPQGDAQPGLLAAEELRAETSYDYTWEVLSLLARIGLTILVELAVALLFGFRKKELVFLAWVNVGTQVVLNVLLNVINYMAGQLDFMAGYMLLEILVFILEAVLYCTLMEKVTRQPRSGWYCIGYALVANVASYITGYELARLIPGIF